MAKKRTRSGNRVASPAPDRRRVGKLKKVVADVHKRYGDVLRRLAK
jgi:hypothetical protein